MQRRSVALVLALVLAGSAPAAATPRACSLADAEVLKIGAWDLDRAFDRAQSRSEAVAGMAAMIATIDADVLALQGVSASGEEVSGILLALRAAGRCQHALPAPGGLAILYDPATVEPLMAEGTVIGCDGKPVTSPAGSAPAAEKTRAQLAHFVAKSDPHRPSAFDFALYNVDAAPEDLADLAERFRRIDETRPDLAAEQDRIVLGDLAIDGARLTREFFPGTKALINLMLKINSGLSDKTFDQAVAAARRPGAEPDPHNDNILVPRWDQPGTCPGEGYCGGLEEFINARVYRTDAAGAIGTLVHPPVAARFCRYADSDPGVPAVPASQSD